MTKGSNSGKKSRTKASKKRWGAKRKENGLQRRKRSIQGRGFGLQKSDESHSRNVSWGKRKRKKETGKQNMVVGKTWEKPKNGGKWQGFGRIDADILGRGPQQNFEYRGRNPLGFPGGFFLGGAGGQAKRLAWRTLITEKSMLAQKKKTIGLGGEKLVSKDERRSKGIELRAREGCQSRRERST